MGRGIREWEKERLKAINRIKEEHGDLATQYELIEQTYERLDEAATVISRDQIVRQAAKSEMSLLVLSRRNGGGIDLAIYITGDTHGDFSRLGPFTKLMGIRKEKGRERDICIILGDVGLNYFCDARDVTRKNEVSRLPFDLFCIHGNHEARPENVEAYEQVEWHGGTVYRQKEFPHLLFARDGEIYDFAGKKTLVIGGAYSVDKEYRLAYGYRWFPDEQPSTEVKKRVEQRLNEIGWKIDIVLSHTCPLRYVPIEAFVHSLDQSKVDKSTEEWLGKIEEKLHYQKWYCGHFHIDKRIDKMEFLFQGIRLFII